MEELTINHYMMIARSKWEEYNLFWVQGIILLPPIDQCNHVFIKDNLQKKEGIQDLFTIFK